MHVLGSYVVSVFVTVIAPPAFCSVVVVVTLFPVSGVVVDVDSDTIGAGTVVAGAVAAGAAAATGAGSAAAGAGVVAAGAGSDAAGAGAAAAGTGSAAAGAGVATAGAGSDAAGAGAAAAGAGSAAAGAGADTVVVTSDETLTTPVGISTECCSTSLCAFVSTVTPGSPPSPFSAANTLISPNAVAPPTASPAAMTLFASLDIFPVFSLLS